MIRLVCFHLFNDYSGSPKMLKMVLEHFLNKGLIIDLITSQGGVLDDLRHYENLHFHICPYSFSSNRFITFLRYSFVQIFTFLYSFRWITCKKCTFLINTILPIGPAIAGKIMGKRIIYYYHENAYAKGSFYKILAWGMQKIANNIICVSKYQASFLKEQEKIKVIPNALPETFINHLHPDPQKAFIRQTVLMLSSLKEYKGTKEFIELAKRLPQFKFNLIINDTIDNINKFLIEIPVPPNLKIFSRQSDVAKFYNNASLTLNLTDSNFAIETFGLTALESMAAGLPVIVPTIGGIAEMVQDGVNGYKIDVQNLDKIQECLNFILSNFELYRHLSDNAITNSRLFNEKNVTERIYRLIK